MSYHEEKDPGTVGKDGKPKAPEYRRNALKNEYQEMLRNPVVSSKAIKILTLDMLLEINEKIKQRASKDHRIEYGGSEDYHIKTQKLKILLQKATSKVKSR